MCHDNPVEANFEEEATHDHLERNPVHEMTNEDDGQLKDLVRR